MMLNDFFSEIECGEIAMKNAKSILKCKDLVYSRFHSYSKNINKDEKDDISQDLIVLVLEADQEFDPITGASFMTFLFWKLQKMTHNFCGRYRGVKYTSRARQEDRKEGTLAFINITEFKGGG